MKAITMRMMKKRPSAFQIWAQNTSWFNKPWSYLFNVIVLFWGFGILVYVPTVVLADVLRKGATTLSNGQDYLILSVRFEIVMIGTAILMIALSGGLAGLMRSLYRGGLFDNWWSLLGSFVAFGGVFLYVGHVVRQISNALAPIGGDTAVVFAYLTGWLLLLGYTAKVPWDEFRDRCATYCERNWDLRYYWQEKPTPSKAPPLTTNRIKNVRRRAKAR